MTAWFEANQTYPEARNTSYQNFPKKWVYMKGAKKWKPRDLGLLLTMVTGATSFANLCTVNNVQYDTYKEACLALGLLENDNEWAQCLTEAGEMQTGSSL